MSKRYEREGLTVEKESELADLLGFATAQCYNRLRTWRLRDDFLDNIKREDWDLPDGFIERLRE